MLTLSRGRVSTQDHTCAHCAVIDVPVPSRVYRTLCSFIDSSPELCIFVESCSFVSFRLLNDLFREMRNIRNRVSHAKSSYAKHEISRKEEHFFAQYENLFAWNSRDFCTKETRVNPNQSLCRQNWEILWGVCVSMLYSSHKALCTPHK